MIPYLLALTLILACVGVLLLLKWAMSKWVHHSIATHHNHLLEKHFLEVENIYRQMRGWKHDYHNHIQLMQAYIEMGRFDEMAKHLSDLTDDMRQMDTVLKTGNIMIDAILNSKISLMMASGVMVNAKATVPSKHSLSDVDLCALIGNLLDNAMEAVEKVHTSQDRFVRIYIRPMKGQLYISVSNACVGKPKKGFLVSKKSGDHGLGLYRIHHLTSKYGGYVNQQMEEGVFATEVTLPFVPMEEPFVQ